MRIWPELPEKISKAFVFYRERWKFQREGEKLEQIITFQVGGGTIN